MKINKNAIICLDVPTVKNILKDKDTNKYNKLRFLTCDTMKTKTKNSNEGKRKMTPKKSKKTNKKSTTKKTKDVYTLNQIGDALFNFINSSTEQFKKIDNQFKKVDDQFKKVDEQFKKVDDSLKQLDNKIDLRFNEVNERLDYIVEANNLKDLVAKKKNK